jgi:F0F1-type ATP synthase delta subunit
MTIPQSYARALFVLLKKNPKEGKTYVKNLHEVLKRRGHEKLLRQIFAEYEKLVLHQTRMARYREVTPHKERTRILLELYKTLTHHG